MRLSALSEEVDKMQKQLSKEEIYAALNERHSPETQAILSEGNVAIAGLGGLGSNVAYSLTRIGVGHLHLIDFDVVDVTNLNRQQYFMEHVGMYKTEALKSLLMKINPYIEIKTDCVRVTEENIKELFCDNDIVCEAFDNPATLTGKIASSWRTEAPMYESSLSSLYVITSIARGFFT